MVLNELQWLQSNNYFVVEPHSPRGGGLFLSRKKNIQVVINSSSYNFIDTTITYKGNFFHTTFVYGEPNSTKPQQIWRTLSNLHLATEDPWFLTGDFNEIVDNSEKCGGLVRAEGTFCVFRSFISQNDLFDLKFTGSFLSWRGKRHSHLILCRLDRAMCNSAWMDMFPSCRSQYLKFESSDHRPLISYLDTSRKKSQKIFRFDRRLTDDMEVNNLIKEVWSSSSHLIVEARLSLCRHAIWKWSKAFHENSQKRLKETRELLDLAMVNLIPDEPLIHEPNVKLLHLYKEDESFWKQRSRQLWLSLGDSNTGYFHASAKGRSAKNRFSVIENNCGVPVYEEDQISEVIYAFYTDLFRSSSSDSRQTVCDALAPCITNAKNEELIAIPQAK